MFFLIFHNNLYMLYPKLVDLYVCYVSYRCIFVVSYRYIFVVFHTGIFSVLYLLIFSIVKVSRWGVHLHLGINTSFSDSDPYYSPGLFSACLCGWSCNTVLNCLSLCDLDYWPSISILSSLWSWLQKILAL